MNGTIEVLSEKGVGSTFTVEIQTRSCAINTVETIKRRVKRDSVIIPSKIRVMIVEDNKFNAEILEGFMNKRSQDLVGIAENGQIAVDMYKNSFQEGSPIHLITMDIEMPIMDGKRASIEIRKFEAEKGIKPSTIVIVSANISKNEIGECLDQSGPIQANYFLRKPVQKSDFEPILKQVMHKISPLSLGGSSKSLRQYVLVADDDPYNLNVMDEMLQKGNHKTILCSNGLQAFESYQKNHSSIKIILMDCQMEIMDGFIATKKILEFADSMKLRHPIIYAVTGLSSVDIEQKCKSFGMANVIKKPIAANIILDVVAKSSRVF